MLLRDTTIQTAMKEALLHRDDMQEILQRARLLIAMEQHEALQPILLELQTMARVDYAIQPRHISQMANTLLITGIHW